MSTHCHRYPNNCSCGKEFGTRCHLPEGHPMIKPEPTVATPYTTYHGDESQEILWREVDRIFNVNWSYGMPDHVMEELKEKFTITRKQ